jgi:type IV pilus assembly protein PilB
MPIKNIPIGQILLETNTISPQQLEKALQIQKENGSKKLGDILVDSGIITEKDLMKALEQRLKVPFVDLGELTIEGSAPGLISREMAEKYTVIPIASKAKTLTVATCDPHEFLCD